MRKNLKHFLVKIFNRISPPIFKDLLLKIINIQNYNKVQGNYESWLSAMNSLKYNFTWESDLYK